MRVLRSATLALGALVLVVLLMLTDNATGNPLAKESPDHVSVKSLENPAPAFEARVGMVQTLTCTNPNCMAQCRGRGYRRGSCQIGRCFCSYV